MRGHDVALTGGGGWMLAVPPLVMLLVVVVGLSIFALVARKGRSRPPRGADTPPAGRHLLP